MPKEFNILDVTKKANKKYSFDNEHNPRIISEYWFQKTPDGDTLFLVFYSLACRYSKCLGCNLPSKMSENHVDYKSIMKQVDYVFDYLLDEAGKNKVRKIIISNNGSILDEETFSTTALMYLLAKINMECENVKTISIETRPEYVDIEELELLSRILSEGKNSSSLEIVIGVEAFDDKIRNDYFGKGLDLAKVEKMVKEISYINETSHKKRSHLPACDLRLKTYFMQKPIPNMTEEDAISDIKNAIDYLHWLSSKYNVEINMHLNPTYVAKGTELEVAFKNGNYFPPKIESVFEAVAHGRNKSISIFVGVYDEGLAIDNGTFYNPDDKRQMDLVETLLEFNVSQDYDLLQI